MSDLKRKAAKAALAYLTESSLILGVGTGSTVDCFIEELVTIKARIEACVASSLQTENKLKALGFPVIDLNSADAIPFYVDGADEVNQAKEMIKGGGGAHTREKIIATVAEQFIAIVDETKVVKKLGSFPIAVEVLPIARSFVAREIVKLGGDPAYREGFKTDNGNIILDVYNLELLDVPGLEKAINLIPGVVENGLFSLRVADQVIIGCNEGIKFI